MTRILAMADSQIGVQTLDLADQREVLDRIVQLALDREVDIVLHGGDVFEGPIVMPEHLGCFIDATRPLGKAGIPLFVIRGNGRHDMAVRSVHALEVLREVDWISVADRPTIWAPPGVTIVALPWVHPGQLVAQWNGKVDHDSIHEYMSRLLVKAAGDFLATARRTVDDGRPVVLLAHWAISGSKLPTGLSAEEMREPVLPWAELDELGYDAIIGAHIHEPQQISDPALDQTVGIVVGSPQQLNHGEKGEHGVWIIEVEA